MENGKRHFKFENIVEFVLRRDFSLLQEMDFSLEEKFCKYFKIVRQSFNEVNVVFNIETYKVIVSLFYDEKIDIEEEKGFLDQFARKRKICK